MAERNNIKRLTLTHINRDFRKKTMPKLLKKITSNKVKIIIPNPLNEHKIADIKR